MLKSLFEPSLRDGGCPPLVVDTDLAFERMLETDLSADLLTQQCPDDGTFLLSHCVPRDVVCYREEDEGVQEDVETVGGFIVGEKGIGVGCCHGGLFRAAEPCLLSQHGR